jgi:hypothetical protein
MELQTSGAVTLAPGSGTNVLAFAGLALPPCPKMERFKIVPPRRLIVM